MPYGNAVRTKGSSENICSHRMACLIFPL